MPTAYPIPQHLQGSTPAELGQLVQAGQRLGLEKQRLAQQAQQAQMEISMRQDMAAKDMQRQQALMETQKAYQQIQTTLEQKKLDQAQQIIGMRAQQAARQFQAQQGYQRAVQSGMEPSKALLMFGPAMGETIPAGAFKANTPVPEPYYKEYGPPGKEQGFVMAPGSSGSIVPHQIVQPKTKSVNETMEKFKVNKMLLELDKNLKEAQDDIELKASDEKSYNARIESIQEMIDDLNGVEKPQTTTGTNKAETETKKRFKYNRETGKIEPIS